MDIISFLINFCELQVAGIALPVGIARFQGGPEVADIAYSVGVESLDPVGSELRDGDRRQNADDRDDYQQLDQGEAFSVSEFH
jgi:hypothetical protein